MVRKFCGVSALLVLALCISQSVQGWLSVIENHLDLYNHTPCLDMRFQELVNLKKKKKKKRQVSKHVMGVNTHDRG